MTMRMTAKEHACTRITLLSRAPPERTCPSLGRRHGGAVCAGARARDVHDRVFLTQRWGARKFSSVPPHQVCYILCCPHASVPYNGADLSGGDRSILGGSRAIRPIRPRLLSATRRLLRCFSVGRLVRKPQLFSALNNIYCIPRNQYIIPHVLTAV